MTWDSFTFCYLFIFWFKLMLFTLIFNKYMYKFFKFSWFIKNFKVTFDFLLIYLRKLFDSLVCLRLYGKYFLYCISAHYTYVYFWALYCICFDSDTFYNFYINVVLFIIIKGIIHSRQLFLNGSLSFVYFLKVNENVIHFE